MRSPGHHFRHQSSETVVDRVEEIGVQVIDPQTSFARKIFRAGPRERHPRREGIPRALRVLLNDWKVGLPKCDKNVRDAVKVVSHKIFELKKM